MKEEIIFTNEFIFEDTIDVEIDKKWRAIGVDNEIENATHRNSFYFKFYDMTKKNSNTCARIGFTNCEYFLNHRRGKKITKDWFLKSGDKKDLIKILSMKYYGKKVRYANGNKDFIPSTNWEYLLTIYNNMVNIPFDVFMETDVKKVLTLVAKYEKYIPIIYPYPDYTMLPNTEAENKEVKKHVKEYEFDKWIKKITRSF